MSEHEAEQHIRLTIDVAIFEARENPLFQEWQRQLTRFMHFSKPVPCAHCGKRKKKHWTQLKFFHVMEEAGFTLSASDKQYPPLTPVCQDHILKPVLPDC